MSKRVTFTLAVLYMGASLAVAGDGRGPPAPGDDGRPAAEQYRATSEEQMNTFRACDAFEYVDAYRSAVSQTEEHVSARLVLLNYRMEMLIRKGEEVPSYLLAAYRGLEDAQNFLTLKVAPTTVTLDQSEVRR